MIEKTIRIDFFKPYKEKIEITQYTKDSVIFHFVLTGGGLPIDLTGCDVIFYAKKPDGEILFNDCVTTNATAGKADYTVTGQTAAAAGDLECWIVLVKAGPKVLPSPQIKVTVNPAKDNAGAIESTSEFTNLEALAATIAALDADVAQIKADITALDGRTTQNENDIEELENDIAALESERTGWKLLNEAWTYSSSTGVNVPSGALSRHQIGDMIKFSQHGAVKCFDCTGVTNTTLTLVPRNGTHSIEDTAAYPITDIYYSHGAFPFGCPASGSIRAIDSGASSATTTGTAVTFATGRFSKLPNMMFGERYVSASGAATAVPVSVKYDSLTKTGVTLVIPSGDAISTFWTAIELYP